MKRMNLFCLKDRLGSGHKTPLLHSNHKKPAFHSSLRKLVARCVVMATVVAMLSAVIVPGVAAENIYSAGNRQELETALAKIPADWPAGPELHAKSAIVIEANSGAVLYAKEPTMKYYPASVTKILTGLLAIENANLSDTVTFSRTAIFSLTPGASNIALNPGEELSVEDSLFALLLPSANEVANGLAEHVSGSIEEFVSLMNERAQKIGVVNTHFVNANGLHDEEHYSCAYDLAMIFRECIANPTFLRIDSTPTYIIPPTNKQPEQRPIGSTDKMMRSISEYYDPLVVAAKTGSTPEAGHNLVSYASNGTLNIIVVVLGSGETPEQYEDTKALMNYSFDNFTVKNIAANDVTYNALNAVTTASPITIPRQEISLFNFNADDNVVMPNGVEFEELASQLEFKTGRTDGSFATVNYTYAGYVVGQGHLIMSESVYRDTPEEMTTEVATTTETEESGSDEQSVSEDVTVEESASAGASANESVDDAAKDSTQASDKAPGTESTQGMPGYMVAVLVLLIILLFLIVGLLVYVLIRRNRGDSDWGPGND